MLAQGALTIAIGVGAGLLGSAALTRFLATMLFEIAPTDAIIFCALATLLAGVAVLACLAPAMRADGINVAAARVILRGKEDSRTTPQPQGEVLAEPAGGQARKCSTLQILRANRTSGTKASRRLPTQVVNDKGRCRSHPMLRRNAVPSPSPALGS